MIENIFIVGTGRSGTHFLCRSLLGFENIEDFMNGKENNDILSPITELALCHKPLTNNIITYYQNQIIKAKNNNKIFLDQSHPNLYHVDQLLYHFPNSLFFATKRPIEQTVASMLNHKGVRRWTKVAQDYNCPLPNNFLGIHNTDELTNLPVHVQCARRVKAHDNVTNTLVKKYPNNVRIIDFEKLINNQKNYFDKILNQKELLQLGAYTEKEKANPTVLTKFQDILDNKMLNEIDHA